MERNHTVCKCCNRTADLRFGVCFNCAEAESIIEDGTDMYDKPIEKKEGMSLSLSKVQKILNIFGVTAPK